MTATVGATPSRLHRPTKMNMGGNESHYGILSDTQRHTL